MNGWEGRAVMITGGAGFIGSHLVEELHGRGANITVVDNFTTGDERNLRAVDAAIDVQRLDLSHDDLRPLLAELQPATIFHVAGNASVPASVEDPRTDFERNVIGTFNLLEAVRDRAPESRIVHCSSATVYGQGVRMRLQEEDATLPVAPYGVSKLAAERYVAVFASVYGLHTANARLFPVYGPRLRKQVVYDLMRKIHDNAEELYIFGDGTQERDFNHVANVVEALVLIAERSEGIGEVYNVAADETVTIGDLAAKICERMEVSPRFVYSGDVRVGEAQRWRADTSRIRALGYVPRVMFEQGLTDTVAWFRGDIVDTT